MCLGGGGGSSEPYNAYEDGFTPFRRVYDKWAKADLAKANAGVDFSKLNDLSRFQKGFDRFNKDGAASMEIREMKRQHAIDLGKAAIDNRFNKFDDKYFKKYRGDYTGYYNPQVEEQYNKTGDKLAATLADRGMLESSVGNASRTDLTSEYGKAKQNIANEALDASNKLRSQVESSKSNLYSINEASADPMGVNAQAVGASTALVAPPQYSPLGQIFVNALQPFANTMSGLQSNPSRNYVSNYSTTGSGKVVR